MKPTYTADNQTQMRLLFLLLTLFVGGQTVAQIQTPKTPETQKFTPVNPNGNTTDKRTTSQTNTTYQQNQSRNRVEYEELKNEWKADEEKSKRNAIQYDFPSLSHLQGTGLYYKGFEEIKSLISSNDPNSLQKAVFTVENAWFGGKLDYSAYDKTLSKMANEIRLLMNVSKLDSSKNKDKIFAIFRYMTDTLATKDAKGRVLRTLPFRYDFDDFLGEKDYASVFVTKLMQTRKGNCQSLPLLFLILCEKLKAEAFIAYAPNHTFVKFRDGQQWVGIELTRGMVVSDAALIASGHLSTTAIKNNVYLSPTTNQQLIVSMLGYLAEGYETKFGHDPFVLKCYETVIANNPTNPLSIMSKSNYFTYQLGYILQQTNKPPKNVLKDQYPQGYQVLLERDKVYQRIDDLGIVTLSKEEYQAWLKNLK